MKSPLEQCRDALRDDTADMVSKALRRAWQLGQTYWQQADSESYIQNKRSETTQAIFEKLVGETQAALAAADAALAAQPEPVAWAQLGMRNGHTYVRMNYEGHLYPPPPDVQRNLNLTPLYAAPVDARPRDDGPHINRWAVREVWFDENGEPGLHRAVDLRDAAPVAQPLTDDQISAIVREAAKGSAIRRDGSTSHRIARAIERAHGIAPKEPA